MFNRENSIDMLSARITGIASYIPDYVLTNEELTHMVDTSDEWITTRVGIKERRLQKGTGLGSSELGKHAVERLLESTGTKPEEIELVICATSNPDYRFPSTASIIAHKCGLNNCYAYDIQAACAGFIVALQSGAAYIKSGLYKKVIVMSAEMMSSMVNYKDRTTCPLFGDAAGAVLLEPSEQQGVGIIDGVFHVDGEGLPHLIFKPGGSAYPAGWDNYKPEDFYLHQDGRAVYKHAVTDMLTASLDIMKRNNLSVDDVNWFVPHQANLRIIEAVGDRLGIAPEKILVNIQYRGNTSAATIPLCLDENKQRLKKGDKIVLAAFGAGFTWGAMYVIWDM